MEQLQPRAKLWTTSSGLRRRSCCDTIHLEKGLCYCLPAYAGSFQGLFPRHHSRAWLAGLLLSDNKSRGPRCSHLVHGKPCGFPEDTSGMPLPESPFPCDSVPWHSPTAYQVSLPLEFPLPCFFLSCLPLSCSRTSS